MKRVVPKYTPYKMRILSGLAGVFIFSLLFTFLIFITELNKYRIAASICIIMLIAFNLYKLFMRSKRYIKYIKFSETLIEIVIVEKEKELPPISIEVENIKIKIVQLFFGFNRIGKNFKLQIDVRENGKFEKKIEQYEIGGWDLMLFKESYDFYSEVKGFSFTAGLDRQ